MNETIYLNAKELIKQRLNENSLSKRAKEELGKRAETIYCQLTAGNLGRYYSEQELVDASNEFACNEIFCAVPSQLPKLSLINKVI